MGEKGEYQQFSLGVRYLLIFLNRAERELKESKKISKKTCQTLLKCLIASESGLRDLLIHYDPSGENKAEDQESPSHTADLLEAIDIERSCLEDLLETLVKNDEMERDAKIMSLYLPENDDLDKLLRYETTIEKQLYRALDQLQFLQLRRKLKDS